MKNFMFRNPKARRVDYVNGTKTCGDCGESKHFSEYSMTKAASGKIPRSLCRPCRSESVKKWRSKQVKLIGTNKERLAYADSTDRR